MKSKRQVWQIVLMLILSLTLLSACKADAPSPAAVQDPNSAVETGQLKEQLQDQPRRQAETPKPAEVKPEEASTQDGAASKTAQELPKAQDNDKTLLHIAGSGVDKAVSLSLDELKAIKNAYVEDDFFSLNSYDTKEYFSFKGVKLSAILEKAGLKKSAATITFTASDGYEFEMTIEQALKEDYIDEQNPDKKYPVIIAWHENGTDYDPAKGAPFRLVIGQKGPGDVNKPQWVQNVAAITVN